MGETVSYRERVFVAGQTRSGKSEFLNHLFTAIRCQKLLLDTKGGEWEIDGVERARAVEEIDWSQPVIHFVTQTDDPEEIDELFSVIRRRRHLNVCCHELGDLCAFNTNRTPPNVSAYLSKGGAHGLGLMGGSQRPVEMPSRARTEAQHVFVFAPALGDDDLKAIAGIGIGTTAKKLKEALDQVHSEFGDYSFLWFTKGVGEPAFCKPLPESVRAKILVKRAPGVK